MGYENVYEYEGGKQAWIDAGYPTESGASRPRLRGAPGTIFDRLFQQRSQGEVSELAEGARLEIA
jgi:3-mercaptopyruvate sulfurtransferase SseA